MNNTIITKEKYEKIKFIITQRFSKTIVNRTDYEIRRSKLRDDFTEMLIEETEALTSLVKEKYNEGFYDGVKAQQDIIEKEYQAQFEECKKGRHGNAEDNGFGKPAICSICGEDL